MEGLFNLNTILLHTLNALILFVAVYFLAYKPIREFLDGRSEGIAKTLRDADEALKGAREEYDKAQEKNRGAQDEVQNILKSGAQQASERAQSIIDDARAQAEEIIQKARREAQDILANAREAMADETAALSVEIASKVLGREISLDEHRQMIDDFIKKVG